MTDKVISQLNFKKGCIITLIDAKSPSTPVVYEVTEETIIEIRKLLKDCEVNMIEEKK